MRSRNLRSMELFMVLFCMSLTSIFILSCSSDSSADDDPQTYNASGTYVYDIGTGVLTAAFTYSEFPGCGPVVDDVETYDVNSISATTMVWNEGEENMITWERDSGEPTDITGTWDYIDNVGNAYEQTIDADGSINVTAEIIECSDGQCDIKAIVKLGTGKLITGATVTANGKSCITSSGTCTINNVTPCGGTFTTTASYSTEGSISEDVTTNSNGGTSQVQLTFPRPSQ